jgi:hypothetical protein
MKLIALCAALVVATTPSLASAEFVSEPIPADRPIGTGPYPAIMEMDPGLPTHTVYRPAELAKVAAKMPIVVWGNGACRSEGNRYHYVLSEIASHGYLVIALGPIGPSEVEIWRGTPAQPSVSGGPGQPPVGPAPAAAPMRPRTMPTATSSSQMIDAINWAQAENSRSGGRFSGRLDSNTIAVMGTSCGGAQAIEVSGDTRIDTTIVWNSGLFPEPISMGGKTLTKDDLKLLHAPVAYISGDELDIAFNNANDDFERLNHVPVLRAYRKQTGHEGTFGETNGGDFGRVGVAWLNWRLKGDAASGQMFLGPQCALCTDTQWVVKQKKLR